MLPLKISKEPEKIYTMEKCEGWELRPGGQIFVYTAFHVKTSVLLRPSGDPVNNLFSIFVCLLITGSIRSTVPVFL